MSFDQHPADDSRGNDAPGDDTTGRIYTSGDHTAHLPAHPQPQAAYGEPQQQPHPQHNPYAAPAGAGRPAFGGGHAPGQQPPQAPHQQGQQPYGGGPAHGAYAAPTYTNGGQQGGGQQGGFPNGPYNPAGGSGNGSGTGGTKRSKRWAAVPVAAVLAAALASGGTWALTKDDNGSSTASGGSTTVLKANPADFGDAGMVNWSATASKVSPSVVAITVRAGGQGDQGSGVILDKDGNIVTNNHVVTGAGSKPTVTVTLNNNRTYKAKVVGTDSSTDLAVVKLENPPDDLKPITLGDDSKLVVGQPVMAVGNPLGLAGTVTTGIVSALNRPVTTQQESQGGSENPFGSQPQQQENNSSTTNAIQTSAAINPGNSGGALVSGSGKLVGINSSIATLGQSSASSQAGNIGIGFAIPVSVVKNITSQLIDTGKVKHPQIGVQVNSNPDTVKLGDATVQAAKISKVNSGSPADKAGLKAGDDVIKFNGRQVSSSDALIGYVRAHNVGDKVTLTIVRDGKQQDVSVTLGEASSS
ncbi:MAG TPA: trypsin-like peptidase domain-containing protein [Flexivirga sp.]|uniref:S1C family serine protease n=1 Tax=Flexivirga sp. TaxID=1962927 RepID=UPI002C953509|nr:trypsin-like peptidase domain-containing protein [Flexivirga sp.]HWC23059.1 trypsin-like peptidase domain-containing protein [Flexivirga sp.]